MMRRNMFVILPIMAMLCVVLSSCGGNGSDDVINDYTWSRQADIGAIDISACSPNHAWAVVRNNIYQIYFYDGDYWTQRVEPQSVVEHVFCLDGQHSWASGSTGTIYSYDGFLWANQGETAEPINGISGTDPEHVWAAGGLGTIYFFDGNAWTKQFEGDMGFDTIFALDDKHVLAATNSAMYFYDGMSWSVQDDSMGASDITGTDEYHVWAAKDASIFFFNGAEWSEQFTIELEPGIRMMPSVADISAADTSHVWAVGTSMSGSSSAIYFFDGNVWTAQYEDEAVTFQCVFALDEKHIWAGAGEAIYFGAEAR